MTAIVVRVAAPRDLPVLLAVRHEVFVVGQGVPVDLERDDLDAVSDHAVAELDGRVVGTGRLVPGRVATDGSLEPADVRTVGRMAVTENVRGRGVGALLLAELERLAAAHGAPAVELHAQVHARPFYERAGYSPFGEVYLEADIEHIGMRKPLR